MIGKSSHYFPYGPPGVRASAVDPLPNSQCSIRRFKRKCGRWFGKPAAANYWRRSCRPRGGEGKRRIVKGQVVCRADQFLRV